jgi:hypothetical protein
MLQGNIRPETFMGHAGAMGTMNSKAETGTEVCLAALRTGVLLAAAMLLAACAQTETKKPGAAPPPVNLSGYSPSFKEGFKQGCNSARGYERRDEARAVVDSQYAQGWQDGKAICGKR